MNGGLQDFKVGKKLIDMNQTVALVDENNEVQVFDSLSYAELEIIEVEKPKTLVDVLTVSNQNETRIVTGLIRAD